MNNTHLVDILSPPDYKPSGETQDIIIAIRSGAWLHVTNLWLYRTSPELEILFQQRDQNSPVFPGLLDCSVAGYLEAGEDGTTGGMREAKEELGIILQPKQLHSFGRHLNAGLDHRGRERKWVINEYIVQCQKELAEFTLDEAEVPAIFWIKASALLTIEQQGSLAIRGLSATGETLTREVTRANFVPNIDDYHFRLAQRLQQYIAYKSIK